MSNEEEVWITLTSESEFQIQHTFLAEVAGRIEEYV